MNRLWSFVTNSENVEIVRVALRALKNYDFSELSLQHVPHILFDNIKLPREYQIQIAASHSDPNNAPLTAADVVPYVPGECLSIELFQNIKQSSLDDAVEFVNHLVETEMLQYRSGVYMLAEGRPEPKELQHLQANGRNSPLQAMIRFLCEQSEHKSKPTIAIKCLECVSKKMSRPIPPLNWYVCPIH